MNNDCRKIAIYSRKSKFTGTGESIENQIEICKNKIYQTNPEIRKDDILIFEDEGFSGGNTNRPQFLEMMRLVQKNEIKSIYSYRLDRISRSVVDFANMYEILTDKQVAYISATECYETSTPLGRAMMSIATVFAQLERETIAERIRDNMYALAKSGRWLGGTTPTGYKSSQIVGSVTVDGKERKAFMLEIIREEAETVKEIFNKFLETNSLSKVETYLLQNHIKTKNRKDYTRFSIRSILTNPVYMCADEKAYAYYENLGVEIYSKQQEFDGRHGMMAYNKTLQRDGKANKQRGYDEWIVAVGKHIPIVSGEAYIKVQEMLKQNSSKAYHKPKSNVALLSGLLYCGNCGSFMRPKKTKRLNKNGENIYSYLCEMKEKSKSHNCQIKNICGNDLDKKIGEEVAKLNEDSGEFVKGLRIASKQLITDADDSGKQTEKIQKSINDNKKQIKNLVTALSQSNEEAVPYISGQIKELHHTNQQLKEKISEIKIAAKNRDLSANDLNLLINLLSNIANSFQEMTPEEKRASLRVIVKKIIWDGEKLQVYFWGDTDESERTQREDRK